jgi:hypothetical protein
MNQNGLVGSSGRPAFFGIAALDHGVCPHVMPCILPYAKLDRPEISIHKQAADAVNMRDLKDLLDRNATATIVDSRSHGAGAST